jgi:hypothetical protein
MNYARRPGTRDCSVHFGRGFQIREQDVLVRADERAVDIGQPRSWLDGYAVALWR